MIVLPLSHSDRNIEIWNRLFFFVFFALKVVSKASGLNHNHDVALQPVRHVLLFFLLLPFCCYRRCCCCCCCCCFCFCSCRCCYHRCCCSCCYCYSYCCYCYCCFHLPVVFALAVAVITNVAVVVTVAAAAAVTAVTVVLVVFVRVPMNYILFRNLYLLMLASSHQLLLPPRNILTVKNAIFGHHTKHFIA